MGNVQFYGSIKGGTIGTSLSAGYDFCNHWHLF
jgi:hypothetical protein